MLNVTFEIDTLPHPQHRQGGVKSVTVYFEHLLDKYNSDCEQCAFLPSLSQLSKFLSCSMIDVHTALEGLRNKGYDFFIFGIDCPITLWYPPRPHTLPLSQLKYGS